MPNMRRGRKSLPSRHKSKKMLRHGSTRGKKLTARQRGLFGLIAEGRSPTKLRKHRRKRKKRA